MFAIAHQKFRKHMHVIFSLITIVIITLSWFWKAVICNFAQNGFLVSQCQQTCGCCPISWAKHVRSSEVADSCVVLAGIMARTMYWGQHYVFCRAYTNVMCLLAMLFRGRLPKISVNNMLLCWVNFIYTLYNHFRQTIKNRQ